MVARLGQVLTLPWQLKIKTFERNILYFFKVGVTVRLWRVKPCTRLSGCILYFLSQNITILYILWQRPFLQIFLSLLVFWVTKAKGNFAGQNWIVPCMKYSCTEGHFRPFMTWIWAEFVTKRTQLETGASSVSTKSSGPKTTSREAKKN